jgi:hypothetical protein
LTNLRFKDFVSNHEHGRVNSKWIQRTFAHDLSLRDSWSIGRTGEFIKEKGDEKNGQSSSSALPIYGRAALLRRPNYARLATKG